MIHATLSRSTDADATIAAASADGIKRAVVLLWTELTRILNKSNPLPYKTPSKAGEPPRKRTGHGQRSVIYEIAPDGQSARVGVTQLAPYMAWLEKGTRRIKPRPWLLVTVNRLLPRLRRLAEAK